MNLINLFQLQRELNERITREHQLEGQNLLAEQILALEVELGELANETRCFKYWSNKPPAPRNVILEEYVDGLHFILSLGIVLKLEEIVLEETRATEGENLVSLFQAVFDQITVFHQHPSMENYKSLFEIYLCLGRQLGFTEAEMEAAYYAKNKVNHQRQDQGY